MTSNPGHPPALGGIEVRTAPSGAAGAGPAPLWKALLADRHFVIAALILVATASGWGAAVKWLNVHTVKERAAWPQGVTVSSDFRLTSLSKGFGPFRRTEPNDEVMKMFREDQRGAGETILPAKVLEPLGIGTDADTKHLADRQNNWYVARLYWDTRPRARHLLWRIECYYYTGGGDTVPHVPEICLRAAGMKVNEERSGRFYANVPTVPSPWKASIPFYRTVAVDGTTGRQTVEYYTFSMNGRWGDSRMWVRWELLNPFLRHAYFAKIQFSPMVGPSDPAETDQAAEEFLRYALPEVLKALPSSADMQKLEESASAAPPA
jgi:hypothetical protein